MGRGLEWTFFKKKHTDGQQAYEKMLSITNCQGIVSQNHNDLSPHTCLNGFYPKAISYFGKQKLHKAQLWNR